MSTLSTAAQNAARAAIDDLIDAGSSNGYLAYRTSGDVDLLVITLQDPAVGAPAAGVSTLNPPNGESDWAGFSATPSAAGTVAKVVTCDSDDNVIETFSVGATGSGEEFEVTSLSFTTEIPIEYSAAPTLTQNASYDPTP
jgi:hypothetical protein